MWPLVLRRFHCWVWNRLHGYPRGSISEDGTVVTLSTGKCPDSWFWHHHHDLHRNMENDPVWPDEEEDE